MLLFNSSLLSHSCVHHWCKPRPTSPHTSEFYGTAVLLNIHPTSCLIIKSRPGQFHHYTFLSCVNLRVLEMSQISSVWCRILHYLIQCGLVINKILKKIPSLLCAKVWIITNEIEFHHFCMWNMACPINCTHFSFLVLCWLRCFLNFLQDTISLRLEKWSNPE